MKSPARLTMRHLVLSFVLAMAGVAFATDGKVEKADVEDEAEGKDVANPPRVQGLEMLPEGKTNLGVRLPVFEGARQTMLLKADEMTPKSKEELEMKGVEIRILNDEGAEDTKIVMLSGRYLVSEGLLASDEQTVIHGVDYTLTGATMDFNTEKKYGVMRGPVKMVLRDFNQLTGAKKDGGEAKKEGEDPAAPARTESPIDTKNETLSPVPPKQ